MRVRITPTKLKGVITPPPSKSQAHRLVLGAALGNGTSAVRNLSFSQDIRATLSCVEQLGAAWEERNGVAAIRGIGQGTPVLQADGLPHFHCGESGSTLRFMIPIALAVCGGGVFTGEGRLMERPQQPYFDLFDEKGIEWKLENGALTVRGRLEPGDYALAGNVSSQFFTGLLYALALLDGPSTLRSTTKLESVDYIMMTLDVLELAGVKAGFRNTTELTVAPGTFGAIDAAVEADWSQAAFWYAAAGIGNEVEVIGMNMDSHQGDMSILDWGDRIEGKPLDSGFVVPIWGEGEIPAASDREENTPHTTSIVVSRCPDLVPPASAWGALMNGVLYLENAARLRIKESDRLAAVHQTLEAMGAKVWEEPERLIIEGQASLKGGVTVDCCNDHRIAMMAAIAATRCEEPVTLAGAECVRKSYPNFWDDYEALGGLIEREGTL